MANAQPPKDALPRTTHSANPNDTGSSEADPSATQPAKGRVHWDGSTAAGPRSGKRIQPLSSSTTSSRPNSSQGGRTPDGRLSDPSRSSDRRVGDAGPGADRDQATEDAGSTSFSTHLAPPHQPDRFSSDSTITRTSRALDELGQDEAAFAELSRELTKQQSLRHPLDEQPRERAGEPSAAASTDDSPAANPSGVSTPGEWATDDEYDPLADPDLAHVDILPGETDGVPPPLKKSERARREAEAEENRRAWGPISSFFGRNKKRANEERDPEKAAADAPGDANDDGGPTNTKSVPVHGAASGPKHRPSKHERQAARLVRAVVQRGKRPVAPPDLSSVAGMGLRRGPAAKAAGAEDRSGATTPDLIDTAASLDPRPAAVGGVLGNLLRLYENQAAAESRGTLADSEVGEASSLPSTPGTGGLAFLAAQQAAKKVGDDKAVGHGPGRLKGGRSKSEGIPTALSSSSSRAKGSGGGFKLQPPPPPRSKSFGTQPSHTGTDADTGSGRQGSTPPSSGDKTTSRRSGSPYLFDQFEARLSKLGGEAGAHLHHIKKTAHRGLVVLGEDVGIELSDRPKAARNAGGVFGALIGTTGNLAAGVAPSAATIGPAPQRPGYKLDRYSLPQLSDKHMARQLASARNSIASSSAAGLSSPARTAPSTPQSAVMAGTSDVETKADLVEGRRRSASFDAKAGTPLIGDGEPTASGASTPRRPWYVGHGKRATASSIDASGGVFVGAEHPHRSRGFGHAASQSISNFARHPFSGWSGGGGSGYQSVNTTPGEEKSGGWADYFHTTTTESGGGGATATRKGTASTMTEEERRKADKKEWQAQLRKRHKAKRKREEIFITMHVAAILQRQDFILTLARSLMMFGAPTHRIETQIQQTARVLDINCRVIYLPNVLMLSFGDETTHTSETKFIKQAAGLDLTKLTDMHSIYWDVIHDKIGVEEATQKLLDLMRKKPLYPRWLSIIIGGLCSAFICVGPQGFNGSFIDALVSFPLGCFLVYCQTEITTELYSNVFEIVFAAINSFVAAGLASTHYFCFSAIASASIVLILPGFIILTGAMELQAKNLIAGSVRMVYAIIYSLFLGFGLSIGSQIWTLFTGNDDALRNGGAISCSTVHADKPWYQSNISLRWALLTVPLYSLCLSLRNQAKINRKEFPMMIAIACAGWAANHFSTSRQQLSRRPDITSALGAFVVGFASNVYGRLFSGRSYVVAVTGVLFQLPSGLSNGGLLNFATTNGSSNDSFNSGFSVAEQLVEIALGLTFGLFASTVLVYWVGGGRSRGGGLFSF